MTKKRAIWERLYSAEWKNDFEWPNQLREFYAERFFRPNSGDYYKAYRARHYYHQLMLKVARQVTIWEPYLENVQSSLSADVARFRVDPKFMSSVLLHKQANRRIHELILLVTEPDRVITVKDNDSKPCNYRPHLLEALKNERQRRKHYTSTRTITSLHPDRMIWPLLNNSTKIPSFAVPNTTRSFSCGNIWAIKTLELDGKSCELRIYGSIRSIIETPNARRLIMPLLAP